MNLLYKSLSKRPHNCWRELITWYGILIKPIYWIRVKHYIYIPFRLMSEIHCIIICLNVPCILFCFHIPFACCIFFLVLSCSCFCHVLGRSLSKLHLQWIWSSRLWDKWRLYWSSRYVIDHATGYFCLCIYMWRMFLCRLQHSLNVLNYWGLREMVFTMVTK